MIKHLIVITIIMPMLVGTINMIIKRRMLSYSLTCITVAGMFLVSMSILLYTTKNPSIHYYFGGWLPPIGIEFKVDILNALFLNIITGAALLTCLYGKKIIFQEIQEEKITSFCSVFLICLAGLNGIVLTNDFFNLYVFIELSALSSYALISIGYNRSALKAAFYYLITGTIGATLILLGIGYLYAVSGTLNMDDFAKQFPRIANFKIAKIGYYLIFIGLFIKCGLFPLHSWLVNAYKNTNSFILPFLGSVSTKAYIFIVLKLIYFVFTPQYILAKSPLQNFLFATGGLAIIVASIAALHQVDLRSMLAFSSVSQIGYIFIALGVGTQNSLVTAVILILNHVISKMALFMICGDIYYKKQTYKIEGLHMLYNEMPGTVIVFLINAASLIGIPLTFGFIAKFSLILSLADQKMWFIVAVVVLSSFITFKYFWSFYEVFAFHKKYHHSDHRSFSNTASSYIIPSFGRNYYTKFIVILLTIANLSLGSAYTKVMQITARMMSIIW